LAEREFDIVMFGGTGFTGGLTADYLAKNAPADTRIALAARNLQKCGELCERIGRDLPILYADVNDRSTIDDVAAKARVVITTVGPYIEFGEPLVAACAEQGTDYVDLTGEPEFVDRMYLAYDGRARESGARIVHACGFDSIPHDLGAQFTVEQLPENVPLTVNGFVSSNGTFSGGTAASALTAFSRARKNMEAAKARREAESVNGPRRAKLHVRPPHREPDIGWVVPLPTIDPQIIRRSARALDRYGPDFTYGHYVKVPNAAAAFGLPAGVAGLFVAAQVPPIRRALLKRVPQGTGPDPERRARSWFKVRFVGQGGGKRVVTEVAGGDPGYDETAKMLAESALCLAYDQLPETAGQLTPAVAMGDALRERLDRAGITFSVITAA
jgi:short subunit dehydrogenase-like uncharacterized protein